jgi:peptidoglycan-associated lipoprotein
MANMRLGAVGAILGLCAACAHLPGRHSAAPAPTPMASPVDTTLFRQLTPPPPATVGRNAGSWSAALRDMSPKLNTALSAGAITGGGITTQSEGVRAVGRLVTSPIPPTDAVHGQVEDALLSSGASRDQIDRLLDAVTDLMGSPMKTQTFPFRSHRVSKLTPDAVNEAVAAFHAVARSATADYLSDPPPEFRATYSTLYELLCAEYTASGMTTDMCAPPKYVAEQPGPMAPVNQDSIDAARARAAADSAAAAARAAADSAAAAARAAADSAAADSAARATADSVARAAADTAKAGAGAEAAAANDAARAAMTQHARTIVETKIYFDFDRFILRDDAKATLDAKLPVLLANPDVRIRIEGNADERGSDAYNQALAMRRAEQARTYLVGHGVTQDRIDIVSSGEEHPVCTDHNEACWSQNRRDDFVIVAGGESMKIPE